VNCLKLRMIFKSRNGSWDTDKHRWHRSLNDLYHIIFKSVKIGADLGSFF
jgi:hypothetical protein